MAQTEEPAIARDCENCYLACGGTADHVSFAAKSSIFRPSDSATNTFLLQSGLVEIAVDADDNRALLALIKPGQLFGWSALFLGGFTFPDAGNFSISFRSVSKEIAGPDNLRKIEVVAPAARQ